MIEVCVRCGGPAIALMSYSYGDRSVWMDDLSQAATPGKDYALCGNHADRISPPVGWTLSDRRTTERLFAPLGVA